MKAGDANPALPFYIFGLGGVIGSLCLLWMPETTGERLPETVEEAEEFGKGQTMFPMPILRRKRKTISNVDLTKYTTHEL